MSIKLRLARAAHWTERAVEAVFRRKPRTPERIEPYIGYATQEQLIVRGRVLGRGGSKDPVDGQSRFRNLLQMIALFLTREVTNVPVTAQGVEALSDEEGYFTITLPRGDHTGTIKVSVTAPAELSAVCPVVVPARDAARGVISDIDDTMILTGAHSLWRNIVTSMTGNVLTRQVFPDAVDLMKALGAGQNPVFFVSSSPWNLHGFLDDIFARAGLPLAPKFLRDYGVSETQFITGTHGDHKGAAIATIMAAQPHLRFVLIGDTGQHDAQVYLDAIKAYPDRIEHVILRQAGPIDAEDDQAVTALRKTGVPVTVGPDYTTAIAQFS